MSVRRQVRLRKEYLYRKGLEGNERAQYEKKTLIRKALAEGVWQSFCISGVPCSSVWGRQMLCYTTILLE
jgi:hypothetical protein